MISPALLDQLTLEASSMGDDTRPPLRLRQMVGEPVADPHRPDELASLSTAYDQAVTELDQCLQWLRSGAGRSASRDDADLGAALTQLTLRLLATRATLASASHNARAAAAWLGSPGTVAELATTLRVAR